MTAAGTLSLHICSTVSIIIVNWNGWGYLEACLSSIAKLPEQYDLQIEVIVVDNGSTDCSLEGLTSRFPWVRVLSLSTNMGFAAASNAGARLATGSFLLFLNNDTIVEAGAIKNLMEAFLLHPTLGLCQPKLVLMQSQTILDATGSFFTYTGFLHHTGFQETDHGQYDGGLFISLSPKGACMMIPRQLFWQIGGFDEDFFAYFEESDLAWRVWLAGYMAGMWPYARVIHAVGATTSLVDFSLIQYHATKNRLCALIKNLEFHYLALVLPIHVALLLLLSLGALVRGRMDLAGAIWRALWWNVRHLRSTLAKRQHVQARIRVVPDHRIFQLTMRKGSLRRMIAAGAWYLRGRWGQ